ncbi:hypothetical protein NF867_10990 [Solitalea sp. MAHUQ-68]|uniref:Adhesin domain-containing protein n=1 Tax=Solitalea agri TaxID=2953739 RepID=A0A9X2F361_9SPHI|nr:hypothetical protein [Solitalea agri]MCO4293391.1 hypothetical protein [Solitalea agri]
MRTRVLHCKFLLMAFLLLAVEASAKDGESAGFGVEKTKKVIRAYQVSTKDKLFIDNKFGSVTINTWEKSEFKVEITVIANDNSDEKAQKQLDRVTISDSKSGNEVRFVTNIASGNSWNWKGDDKKGLEVNYSVYMPSSNSLSIINKYGPTKIADFNGPLSVDQSYGGFTAGNLKSNSNSIIIRYGSGTVESVKTGSFDVSYSKLSIGKAGNVSVVHRYGNLDIDEVDQLSADIDYSGIRINQINQSGSINSKYSSGVKLNNVSRSLKSLVINAAYSGVSLSFADDAAFDVSVNVSYGDFGYNHDKSTTLTESGADGKNWKPSKSFSGHYGSGTINGKIAITTRYGNVKFN